ncbi:hypothetical protein [Paraburkholderia sediminicola]|uniref:hypothetical protein n=1 Tax=Paraburkholderia sediminicola TaxID=458836 RepID=UPI0015828678|nr:hypothetical protein [Paraburkholderia sediminicola]
MKVMERKAAKSMETPVRSSNRYPLGHLHRKTQSAFDSLLYHFGRVVVCAHQSPAARRVTPPSALTDFLVQQKIKHHFLHGIDHLDAVRRLAAC